MTDDALALLLKATRTKDIPEKQEGISKIRGKTHCNQDDILSSRHTRSFPRLQYYGQWKCILPVVMWLTSGTHPVLHTEYLTILSLPRIPALDWIFQAAEKIPVAVIPREKEWDLLKVLRIMQAYQMKYLTSSRVSDFATGISAI